MLILFKVNAKSQLGIDFSLGLCENANEKVKKYLHSTIFCHPCRLNSYYLSQCRKNSLIG